MCVNMYIYNYSIYIYVRIYIIIYILPAINTLGNLTAVSNYVQTSVNWMSKIFPFPSTEPTAAASYFRERRIPGFHLQQPVNKCVHVPLQTTFKRLQCKQ